MCYETAIEKENRVLKNVILDLFVYVADTCDNCEKFAYLAKNNGDTGEALHMFSESRAYNDVKAKIVDKVYFAKLYDLTLQIFSNEEIRRQNKKELTQNEPKTDNQQ